MLLDRVSYTRVIGIDGRDRLAGLERVLIYLAQVRILLGEAITGKLVGK